VTNKEWWAKGAELVGEEVLSRKFRAWISGLIKKEIARRSNMTMDDLFLNQATEILNDLNKRTGCRFRLTDEAKGLIRALLAGDAEVEDFIKVHEVMCAEWLGDPKMEGYLRPSTLWQKSKFYERLALWDKKKGDRRPVIGDGTQKAPSATKAYDPDDCSTWSKEQIDARIS
jgi:uncharacterized phage protein (TIGR02220 family)